MLFTLPMKTIHRGTISIVLFLAAAVMGSSATMEELIGPSRTAILAGGKSLTEVQYRDPQPSLAPQYPYLRRLIDDAMNVLSPSLFVESLSRYQKPSGAEPGTGWTRAEHAALYNATLAISTLKGIEYFSASRNRMRTFYETSTVIDGPDTKRPLEDPSYAIPPEELAIYARQKDLTFGDNIYQYSYFSRSDALIFVQENLSVMNAGPIPVVGKNKLRSIIAVIDAGDALLVYIVSMAKAVSFPGMNERAGRSFSNRADAVMGWFSRRADEAFEKLKTTVSS
jgi:hypothetical protein